MPPLNAWSIFLRLCVKLAACEDIEAGFNRFVFFLRLAINAYLSENALRVWREARLARQARRKVLEDAQQLKMRTKTNWRHYNYLFVKTTQFFSSD
jgi:hypothetical protein